jgi:hypothetical protein
MTYDLSYKAGIIFGATVALPFVVAAIYRWTSR